MSVKGTIPAVALFMLLLWAFIAFLTEDDPRLVKGPVSGELQAESSPQRNVEESSSRAHEETESGERFVSYAILDKLTETPLCGVFLESEAGTFGPSDENGVLRIPNLGVSIEWKTRLTVDYGSRAVKVDLPMVEDQGHPARVLVAAKARIAVSFLGPDSGSEDVVSLLFAPVSIGELVPEESTLEDRMRDLLRVSPFMTHDWLTRNGLAEGRCGLVESALTNQAMIDVNVPGIYNLTASSKAMHGSAVVHGRAGEVVNVDLHLKATIRVAGMVVDEGGSPLQGADITIVCSTKLGEGGVVPQKPKGVAGTVRRNKKTGEIFMIFQRAMRTDAEGCFEWPFEFVDGILVWAFYRDESAQFSGFGRFIAEAGVPRDPENIIITVKNEVAFGSCVELADKRISSDQIISLNFRDHGLAGAHQVTHIGMPVILNGNRLLIDTLPMGQKCRIVSRLGAADFVAVPDSLVVFE